MKPTVPRIERWLSDIEAALIPPPRKRLRVIVYQAVEDKEKALAKLAECNPVLHAGHTVKDISWSDDMAAAKEKALAEHIATHPEDAGYTIADVDWAVFEIVFKADDDNERYAEELPKRQELYKEAEEEAPWTSAGAKARRLFEDELAAVSETPDLNVLSTPDLDCSARSKPWRPVHQRPARDQRRPTWKKWER